MTTGREELSLPNCSGVSCQYARQDILGFSCSSYPFAMDRSIDFFIKFLPSVLMRGYVNHVLFCLVFHIPGQEGANKNKVSIHRHGGFLLHYWTILSFSISLALMTGSRSIVWFLIFSKRQKGLLLNDARGFFDLHSGKFFHRMVVMLLFPAALMNDYGSVVRLFFSSIILMFPNHEKDSSSLAREISFARIPTDFRIASPSRRRTMFRTPSC